VGGLPNGLPDGDAALWPFQSRCFRDVVILALSLRAMLRPSKAVNIKWSHVEFASPLVLSKELALGKIISYSGHCRYRDNTAHCRDWKGDVTLGCVPVDPMVVSAELRC
jgi:hypothetical protein